MIRIQKRIENQAVAWHVRLRNPALDARARARFERWRAASPRHAAAFEQAGRLWDDSLVPARVLGRDGWHRDTPHCPRPGRPWRPALAVSVMLAVLAWCPFLRDPGLAERLLSDLSTPPGHMRTARLADGTQVQLDGDTALDLSLAGPERVVRLQRGRAWFDVAHTGLPFRVETGAVTVRVMGTAFTVEREAQGAEVAVERGRVAVSWSGSGQDALLTAGQEIRLAPGLAPTIAPYNPTVTMAWRHGLIVFDRARLSDVAPALERLRSERVVVVGESLRAQPLSGVFNAEAPDSILRTLSAGLGIRVLRLPGVVTILYR